MMKPRIFAAAVLVTTFIFGAVLHATEMKHQRLSLNVWGSGLTSVHGDFNPSLKTSDVVKSGADYGLAWQYFPWRHFGIQAGYAFGGMRFAKPMEMILPKPVSACMLALVSSTLPRAIFRSTAARATNIFSPKMSKSSAPIPVSATRVF